MATLKVALLGLLPLKQAVSGCSFRTLSRKPGKINTFSRRDPSTAPRKGFAAPSSTTRLPIKRRHARRSAAELPGAGPRARAERPPAPHTGAGHPPAAGDLPARHLADRPERRMGRLRGLAPTIVALDNRGRYSQAHPATGALCVGVDIGGPKVMAIRLSGRGEVTKEWGYPSGDRPAQGWSCGP